MKSGAERQKAWRKNREAEGYRMVTVWLDPDVAKALETTTDRHRPDTGRQAGHTERQRMINEALRRQLGLETQKAQK